MTMMNEKVVSKDVNWLFRESKLPNAPPWSIVFAIVLLIHSIRSDWYSLIAVIPFLAGSILLPKIIKNKELLKDVSVIGGALYFSILILTMTLNQM